jgi:hypothetical protein
MGREADLQKIAERILDDESLRRGLTDDAFQPLLDWAMGRLNRGDRSVPNLDAFGAQLRSVLQAASAAASSRDLRPLQSLVKTPVFSRRESAQINSALSHLTLTDNPDSNGSKIANALAVKR